MAPTSLAATWRRWRGGSSRLTPGRHRAAAPQDLGGGYRFQKGSQGQCSPMENTEGPSGFLPSVCLGSLGMGRWGAGGWFCLCQLSDCMCHACWAGTKSQSLERGGLFRALKEPPPSSLLPGFCCPLCLTSQMGRWWFPQTHSFHSTHLERRRVGGWKVREVSVEFPASRLWRLQRT